MTGSGFPGESAGLLNEYSHWRKIGQATISYGYGLSVTPLQLVRAYATLGAYGVKRPVTLRKVDEPVPGEQVIDPRVAKELLEMMESVVSAEGSGKRASLIGYRVAGKTGTAWTADGGTYSTEPLQGVVRRRRAGESSAPGGARRDRRAHRRSKYYGGDVAAPVFANVMAGALRLMGVPPDGLDRLPATTLVQANP